MNASTLLTDLRYTIRQLYRSPGFTVTALITLGIGIGATISVFTIVQSSLLAPLPYDRADELVGVGFSRLGDAPNAEQTGETATFLLSNCLLFASAGVSDDGPLDQSLAIGSERPQTVRSLRVSSGYLPTLGVTPIIGRTFTAQEDVPGASATAILSESLWRGTFNGDPNVVGRAVHINGKPVTVIGVLPSPIVSANAPDIWQPLHLSPSDPGYQGDNFQFTARLKRGVSITQLSAELTRLTQEIYHQLPGSVEAGTNNGPRPQELAWPLKRIVANSARASLLALLTAVVATLLMACLNLAGLISARSMDRIPEIALRNALGESRLRTIRILMTESFVIALTGSLLGLLLARVMTPLLLTYSPVDIPHVKPSGIDLSLFLFAIGLSIVTALAFGLLPALSITRPSIGTFIGSSRTINDGTWRQHAGKLLVALQVALGTILLSAGAFFLQTFLHLTSIPSGVRPDHLFVVQVNLRGDAYFSAEHTAQFVSTVEMGLAQALRADNVAAVNGLPLDHGLNELGGPVNNPGLLDSVQTRFITPGYFRTVGTGLIRGNELTESDVANSQPVALINERAAQAWFPNRSPVGEYVRSGNDTPRRVIGIVANVHDSSLAANTQPTIYLPFTQVSDAMAKEVNGWFPTTFLVRVRNGPDTSSFARTTTAVVQSADPEVSISKLTSMRDIIEDTVAAPLFFSWLSGGFALFALLLTLIGFFGLLSYRVTSRTREIGVRMAMGAQRIQIIQLVVGEALLLTIGGLLLGLLGSAALRTFLASVISETTHADPSALGSFLASTPATIVLASAAMLLAALFASAGPASRAMSTQPAEALRSK